jgi:cytochrome P450
MPRMAMVPYTFQDGTYVPAGSMLAAVSTSTHLDEEKYDQAALFDGFRFSRRRQEALECAGKNIIDGGESESTDDWKNRMTGTGLDYLSFGGGRHVW